MKRTPLREALESALSENPDDLAAHSAYADYLMEQGDPRGEFIQVQLALENESLERPERLRLESRERELLREHRREWLGDLADLFDEEDEGGSYALARGWLDTVRIEWMEEWLAELLADAPQLALLRQLLIDEA